MVNRRRGSRPVYTGLRKPVTPPGKNFHQGFLQARARQARASQARPPIMACKQALWSPLWNRVCSAEYNFIQLHPGF